MSQIARAMPGLAFAALFSAVPSIATPATEAREARLVYSAPGCPVNVRSRVTSISAVWDAMSEGESAPTLSRIAATVLADDRRVLLPVDPASASIDTVPDFLRAPGSMTRQVVSAELPLVMGSRDVVAQLPGGSATDWLAVLSQERQRRLGRTDLTRTTAILAKYTKPSGLAVLAIELIPNDGSEIPSDPLGYERVYAGTVSLSRREGEGQLLTWARPFGLPGRTVTELRALRDSKPGAPTPLLHAGGVVKLSHPPEERAFCGELVAQQKPLALVPRTGELSLGPEELGAFANRYKLPYVAANLLPAQPLPAATFPRYVLSEQNGLALVVVGLVTRASLSSLPAGIRERWKLEEPQVALQRVLREARQVLGRAPDVVVAQVSRAEGADFDLLRSSARVDVVLGDFSLDKDVETVERIELVAQGAARVHEGATLYVRASPTSIGELVFRAAAGASQLTALENHVRPVFGEGPFDREVQRAARAIGELEAKREARLYLPDLSPLVAARPELEPLVWGDRLQFGMAPEQNLRRYPPLWSDLLWLRLVSGLIRQSQKTEVALARIGPRTSSTVGALSRHYLESWISDTEQVRRVRLTGTQMLELSQRLKRQSERGLIYPDQLLGVAGLNPANGKVGGVVIDSAAHYHVAYTETVAGLPELGELLSAGKVAAEPVALRPLVLGALDAMRDPSTPEAPPTLELLAPLLLAPDEQVQPQWSLRVKEISITAAGLRNSDTLERFAATRETRLTTPALNQLGLGVDVALVYEGRSLAWETRFKSVYDGVAIINRSVRSETQDDLTAFSELRLNRIALKVLSDDVALVPYLRLALDSELTPTPDPSAPNTYFPHQKLTQQSLGLSTRPPGWLTELRLGFLVQQDLSTFESPRVDAGLEAGLKLRVPLPAKLRFESDVELRYLPSDADDLATDLGFRAATQHRLVLPVTEQLSVALFLDLLLAAGKVPQTAALGYSGISGIKLQYGDYFRL